MRSLTVTGFLGTDPEFKTTKNGAQLVNFRMANSERTDKDENGNPISYWYTVTVWDSALQGICRSMKKGSSIIVVGDVSDRVYMSQKTGMPEIGRDISAKAIYFNSNGKRDESSSSDSHVSDSTPKAAPAPKAEPAPQPAQVEFDSNEDDLPF